MLKFAANLTWLFNEAPFIERFALAARAGFNGVECLFPYQEPLGGIADARRQNGLEMVLINAPAGDWARGERGLASLPGRDEEFRQSLHLAREYARALGCRQVHVMAGNRDESISFERQYILLKDRMSYAADFFLPDNIRVLVEPLNGGDMPGYFIPSFYLADKLIMDCNKQNIYLQFDIYHCQKIQGNLSAALQHYRALISHIQIASVPQRQEPDSGELHLPWILKQLEQQDYQGWIGCEYRPATETHAGLGWLENYKQ
ncbi:2-oxo-tetronate isomerase [Acerihabitans sp.]|uniref:2-oxo-tetronate isomerase n=1 Tax=Acerihabitans sp. TaxID=2811394 RepID=UPI002EDA505E